MGALLAFQPTGGTSVPNPAWLSARVCLESSVGLSAKGEVSGGALGIKYARRDGSGSGPARSNAGWLLAAGDWEHPALPPNDTSALLRLLEEKGEVVLADLDGFYAILWQDDRRGVLIAVPDHFGRLHLHAAEAPEGIYLSTSPAALAAAVSSEPDPAGAWEFLSTGICYEERTPFARVRRLQGARRYRFSRGRPESETSLRPFPPPGAPRRDLGPEDLAFACRAAVQRFVSAGRRFLPDLTGGLDSRLVVGTLLDAGFAFDVTVTGKPMDADVHIARRLATRLELELLVEPAAGPASFAAVLHAARRVQGEYDAIEYASILAVHEPHAASYSLSVNGSGGEVFRNYWWGKDHLAGGAGAAVPELLRRFTHSALRVDFLSDSVTRDPAVHFREVLERALGPRTEDPFPSLADHAYLQLRMQCWQGSIASATNRLWSNLSPLLLQRPLEVLYRIPDRLRLGGALMRRLISRFPPAFAETPLADGFPPMDLSPRNAWRFLPGLVRWLGSRVRSRLRRGRPDEASPPFAQRLVRDGLLDFLDPRSLALAPLVEKRRFAAFLDGLRAGRPVPLPLVGRLIALEWALRRSST